MSLTVGRGAQLKMYFGSRFSSANSDTIETLSLICDERECQALSTPCTPPIQCPLRISQQQCTVGKPDNEDFILVLIDLFSQFPSIVEYLTIQFLILFIVVIGLQTIFKIVHRIDLYFLSHRFSMSKLAVVYQQ